ncbi:hypothetical protein SAMN05216262_102109 [Colwellia chukchiensis]|uniref:DUF4178 domain-containing protein n=1 Tax=Colwellia chukchiensis TaxID=641665 RepID=A0A1H7J0Z6_9GAMM|nr:hypothetical protein [Colwellia chukchiensis]SEK68423.1 hypothetical protein SAMN05216262_102109 [Colwellia chukchiensis]
MSFFKNIFSKPKAERTLDNVKDLSLGDIIVISDSFALPAELRAQELQVTAVNSYEFERKNQLEWVLQGNSDTELYLSLDEDDKTYLKFSLKITPQDVETLFDLDSFAEIFEETAQVQLQRQADNETTTGWSSERYQQSGSVQVGYFHRKDHRENTISPYQDQDSGEPFELFCLYNEDQAYGIDIEVWQDGDTDVFLTLFRPTTDLVDMYPGS